MARPLKNDGLVWRETKGWCTRIVTWKDGEKIRPVVTLGTRDRAVARRKRKRLIAEAEKGAAVTEATSKLTVWDAAAMTLERWKRDGVKSADHRVAQLRLHALGCIDDCRDDHAHVEPEPHHIGGALVGAVTRQHIEAVLRVMHEAGYSRQSGVHQRRYLSMVFDDLWRTDVISSNPVAKVRMPKMRTDKRMRAVLTDEELSRYLRWEHPTERLRGAVLERQTMSVVSWCFGGLRTSEIHALRWDDFAEDFSEGMVRRGKTEQLQPLPVPDVMRPYLLRWWRFAGSPVGGLVFPCRIGESAGAGRKESSHAQAMRRDLMRAFGLEERQRVSVKRGGGRGEIRPMKWVAKPFGEWSRRERELFSDTETTRRVDFHSWRRAASGQLARAGVNEQTAMAFTNHSDARTHRRYWAAAQMATLPPDALPQLPEIGGGLVGACQTQSADFENTSDFGSPCWTRTSDHQLRRLLLYPSELRGQRNAQGCVANTTFRRYP